MSRAPGPGTLELLRLARRSKGDTPRLFQSLVARYGDVVAAGAGPARFFLLAHPDQVEQVLETHADRFERVSGERRVSGRLVGDSLFSSEGRAHAWERAVMEPVMYGAAAEAMAGHVTEMGARLRDRLVAGREVELFDLMERFSTDLIVKILFGEDPAGGRGATISRALTETVVAMDHLPMGFSRLPEVFPPSKRTFHAARMTLDAAVADVVAERRASPGQDVLSLLMAARDERGIAMSDIQLRNELVTLYRGHQAVSTALTYAWWQLGESPDVEAAVLSEIDALGSDDPTFEDLPRLTTTRMAFQETLRLYPPAWVLARKAIAPHAAGGIVIPPGARVLVSEWITHRDPRFWDEPLAFRPERFTPEAEAARPKYAYFPQGGGSKMCMGRHFVVPMEAPLLLASVGRRWRFRPVPGRPVEFAARATLKPKRGVYVTAERR